MRVVIVHAVFAELEDKSVDLVLNGVLRMHDIAMTGRGSDGICAPLVLERTTPSLDDDVGCTRADDLPARGDGHVAAARVLDIDGRCLSCDLARNRCPLCRLDMDAVLRRDVADFLNLVRTGEINRVRLNVQNGDTLHNARRGYIVLRLDFEPVRQRIGNRHIADADIACIVAADTDFLELRAGLVLQKTVFAEDILPQHKPCRRTARAGRTEGDLLIRRIGIKGHLAVARNITVLRIECIRLNGDIAVRTARRTVRIDMCILEVDLTAGDGVVPAVCMDGSFDIDPTRAARNRLLNVDRKRHVDRTALVEPSAALTVADVDDLVLPERAVNVAEVALEQGELVRFVHTAAELDVPIMRERQDVECFLALHLAV